jgi:N-acetylmuramoyl-L-alanine amidase
VNRRPRARSLRLGRAPARRRGGARSALALLALLVLAAAGLALAQERHNFLAVDGQLLDDAGPYYFIAHGDASNAFAKAAPLAAALQLDVDYDAQRDVLIFEDARTRAELDVTRDVAAGLAHELGALRVDGVPFGRPVPRGLLVDGTSYVALTPIVEAFGGRAAWHQDARVIEVAIPDRSAGGVGGAAAVAQPRIGRHDGYTRVALDLPHAVQPELRVGDGAVALVLPGTRVEGIDRRLDEGPLRRVYRDRLDGEDALVLVVDHPVDDDGQGYRMGQVEGGVLYVDVGPQLAGEPAAGPARTGANARASEPAPPPERRRTVVLDAGHGGHDPGTVSDWAHEKEIVLDVTLRLAERLEAAGVEVVLTRDHDTFLTLQERSTYATTERNVFVSIHANAAPSGSAQGIETWVFGRPLDPGLIDRAIRENGGGELGQQLTAEAAESADIAGDILRETQLNYSMGLAELVQERMVEATGANDRGVRKNLFYVIRNSRIPAILVELGFVSHPEEGRKLMRSDYRDALADALADGIVTFLANGGEGGELAQR